MKFRAWFDEFTDTIRIEEYSSSGDGIVGAFFAVLVLLGLFIAPAFIPFYLLCRHCKKESSIAQREYKRAIGNVTICLSFTALYLCFKLCLHLTGPETPGFLMGIIMWVLATTPLAMLVSSCYCLFTSNIAEIKAKKKGIEKTDLSKYRKAVAMSAGMLILLRIVTLL